MLVLKRYLWRAEMLMKGGVRMRVRWVKRGVVGVLLGRLWVEGVAESIA
jgi:hypothetical protein